VKIPFADLSRTIASQRGALDAAMRRVLDSGWFVLGEEVASFEREFAAACGASQAIGVASGTDALEVALRGLEIVPGDEVVTQANTCVPTVAAIVRAGATPVLCDVETEAGTMDPDSLAIAIGPRTRAVIPVHLYGQCADLDRIGALAADFDVAMIEDCAQSHGAQFRGRPAGTVGVMGCFSFYPTKNLGALGDGGAVITSDGDLGERLRLLRNYGQSDRYHHVSAGVNSRLDEIQAAILRAKLPQLEERNRRRAEIADVYSMALRGTPAAPLAVLDGRRHVFHLFVVRVPHRTRFQAELEQRGVGTLIHYPLPIHHQAPYRELAAGPAPLRNAEQFADRIVSLPLYPELTDAEVEAVAQAAHESAVASA
jgi:dTDP-4-amino-4,6-dideoxygalactose transaminase